MTLTANREERNGTTYVLRPGWVQDGWDHGYPYFAAVDVATGRTLHEADDPAMLVRWMTARHPEMALVENAVTAQHGIRPIDDWQRSGTPTARSFVRGER